MGNILPKVIGFFLIPIYTIYLTPEDYGILDICTTVTTFLVIVMRFGIPGSVTRFYFDFGEGEELKNYVTTIFRFLMMLSLVLCTVFVILGYYFIESWINGLTFYPFVIWIALEATLGANTSLQRRLIQAREQSSYSMKLNIGMTVVNVPLSILFVVYFKMGLYGLILSGIITAIVFFFQAQYYLFKDLQGEFKHQLLKPSLRYASGIFPSHIMSNIAPLINKILLTNLGSLAAVGILGIAIKFSSPLLIAVSAFQTAFIPIYFAIRKDDDEKGRKQLAYLSKRIWGLSCILFIFLVLLGPSIVKMVTPEKFHESGSLIIFLSVGYLGQVIYTLYGQEIYFNKKTKWVPLITIASIVSNLAIVYFFVEQYGAVAVCIGISVSLWIPAIIGSILSYNYIKLKPDLIFFFVSMCLMSMAIYCSYSLLGSQGLYNAVLWNSILMLSFTIVLIITDKELRLESLQILHKIRLKLIR